MLLTGALGFSYKACPKANEACPILLECHIKTALHPISTVVPALAHIARGHVGVVIPKLGSDEQSHGETERKRPKPMKQRCSHTRILETGWFNKFYSRIFCDATVTEEQMPQTFATSQRERRKLALYISILDPILMLLDTTIPTA